MSRENVEVVRQIFDATARRDTAAVLSLYDPEVEWDTSGTMAGELMGRRIYRGHDGLLSYFRELHDAAENVQCSLHELIDAGDQIVSVMSARGRGRASGLELERNNTGVWTIRDGKVVRVVWFGSRKEALEAVGLRE
jgi:ketosteroid isomerase-like protein